MIEALSSLGIIVPILVIFYFRKDKEKFFRMIALYFLLFGVIYTIKFTYGISRDYIDPFRFPSAHMAFASLLMFLFPNILTVLFAIFIGETRLMLGVHNAIDILVGFLIAGAVYMLDELFGNKKIRRQYVHIGLSMFFAFVLFVNRWFGIVLLAASAIGYLLLYNYGTVEELTGYFGRKKFDSGTMNLLMGLLIVAIFWNYAWIAAIFLGWVDGLATIFGEGKKKSLVGLSWGIVGGIVAAYATHTPLFFAPIIAGVEFFSPTDDNLVIPISVYLLFLASSTFLM